MQNEGAYLYSRFNPRPIKGNTRKIELKSSAEARLDHKLGRISPGQRETIKQKFTGSNPDIMYSIVPGWKKKKWGVE